MLIAEMYYRLKNENPEMLNHLNKEVVLKL